VFTFGSMLVALQVASAQLTPRIIATTLLRDNTIRFTVGLFVFTLLLAVGTKARLQDPLPLAMVTVAIFAGIGSMAAFLYLIDYTAQAVAADGDLSARGGTRDGGDRGSLSRRHRALVRTAAATTDPIPTGKDCRARGPVRRRSGAQPEGSSSG
jgi:Predicted membrane protein